MSGIRPFTETLNNVRYGELNEELTAQWNALVNKVRDTGKTGSMTLKLKLLPGKGMAMEIDDDLKVDMPKPSKGTTLLFPTVEGNLQRADPNQKTLDLQQVDMKTGEIMPVNFGHPSGLIQSHG